jgi:hypothetical protein
MKVTFSFSLSLFVCLLYRGNKELLLQSLTISRTENERCLIEPSINSVRVSIKIKQADEIEIILCRKFTAFLMQRAEQFIIMRRKAVAVSPSIFPSPLSLALLSLTWSHPLRVTISPSSSLMFISRRCGNINLLISSSRSLSLLSPPPPLLLSLFLSHLLWAPLTPFLLPLQFMEDIDKEISGMKIAINARARVVASEFMKQISP